MDTWFASSPAKCTPGLEVAIEPGFGLGLDVGCEYMFQRNLGTPSILHCQATVIAVDQ